MRESPSGPVTFGRQFSFGLRRTSDTGDTINLNMVLAGYGSVAEQGSRIRYIKGAPFAQLLAEIWVGAVRTDGSLNSPPEFNPGSLPVFGLGMSEDYETGPFERPWEVQLTEAQTASAALYRYTPGVLIPAGYDWAINCAVSGSAPGGAQSFVASPILIPRYQ